MCGIVGTIFNSQWQTGTLVTVEMLANSIESAFSKTTKFENLLDNTWRYKGNINFLRYCRDASEQKDIADICISIERLINELHTEINSIDKSQYMSAYRDLIQSLEQAKDAHWFLSNEIPAWITSIEDIAGKHIVELSDNEIVFYKALYQTVNAIDNRLEVRGRDSFGISVVMNSHQFTGNEIQSAIDQNENIECKFFTNGDIGSFAFTFKTFNAIGDLGDNAKTIKTLIRNTNYFHSLIESGNIETATIVAHTRWASVGAVNLENTLPLGIPIVRESKRDAHCISALNGDIFNFADILASKKVKHKNNIENEKCTSDALAIPASIIQNETIDLETISGLGKNLTGSFVITLQHSDQPEEISIIKRGIQGLYLGFSEDSVIFASDIYGLVETCRHFLPIGSDHVVTLSARNNPNLNKLDLLVFSQKTNTRSLVQLNELQTTSITTRDISKHGYDHFLEKEIYETKQIVDKTLNNYVNPPLTQVEKKHSTQIVIDESQVPKFIVKAISSKKIKKIIITGMGTCYTAAVAMSRYMRQKLKEKLPKILVEPHIASEGSGFYLEPDMQDTLVIVIAQSGTTVDTNVFVRMAKERGALSLALANKREGDVTFLVDGTMYIGDGRDIEIAVPSTKTYTAQVLLGYILTLHLVEQLASSKDEYQKLYRDLDELRNVTSLVDESLACTKNDVFFGDVAKAAYLKNSWYIARDASLNAVCAEEIRIKFSENCYQSVTSLTLNEIINLEVSDSFITLLTEVESAEISEQISVLTERGNIIAIIYVGQNKALDQISSCADNNVHIMYMPTTSKNFTFIPTIIAGQILSYKLALSLDDRKMYFEQLLAHFDHKPSFEKSWNIIKAAASTGTFNQGFSSIELSILKKLSETHLNRFSNMRNTYSEDLHNHLVKQVDHSRRTVDTVKHQAKTITVGAVRNENANSTRAPEIEYKLYGSDNAQLLAEIKNSFATAKNLLNFSEIEDYSEILVSCDNLDESFAYNLVNFVNESSKRIGARFQIRLAQNYDHPNNDQDSNAFWIHLNEVTVERTDSNLENLRPGQKIIFSADQWIPSKNISDIFHLDDTDFDEYRKAIWIQALAAFITCELLVSQKLDKEGGDYLIGKTEREITDELIRLAESIDIVFRSSQVHDDINYSVDCYLAKKNWKCIGSGSNYNISKFAAKRLIKVAKRSCSFDVLENHKHIDMSAESGILTFISNLWKHGYQEDALSEIEKMLAHNTLPIIFTNLGDQRFDNFFYTEINHDNQTQNVSVPVIKLPAVMDTYAFALNILVVCKFTQRIRDILQENTNIHPQFNAIFDNKALFDHEYIW